MRAGAAREGSGALGRALGALLPAGRARGAGGSSPLEPSPARAAPGVSPELGRGRGRRQSPRAQSAAGCGLSEGRQSCSSVRCLFPPPIPSSPPCPSARRLLWRAFPGELSSQPRLWERDKGRGERGRSPESAGLIHTSCSEDAACLWVSVPGRFYFITCHWAMTGSWDLCWGLAELFFWGCCSDNGLRICAFEASWV